MLLGNRTYRPENKTNPVNLVLGENQTREKWYPESAAAEYAQKALEQKPNDYNTIYVWTET